MEKRGGYSPRRAAAFALLCLVLFSLGGCAPASVAENTAYCFNDKHTSYDSVVAQILPQSRVEKANFPIPALREGASAVECFGNQAVPALEYGVASYWYAQYLATVIIAVDRDMTDAVITGWGDLSAAGEVVGYAGLYPGEMLFAALAYGLEGEDFSLGGAAELLAGLRVKGLFAFNSYENPITICYDYQAAAMIKEGRNLEVIVPREGTLTYERGLLSNEPLSFSKDEELLLLEAGLRLPDGRCDSALYADASAYGNAGRLTEYSHINRVCQDGTRILRRTVLLSKIYSSADGKEHLLFALLYMILVIVWLSTVMRRAMPRSVQLSALITAVILVGWMAVRTVKYQIFNPAPSRYLWYSYYLFQLALPVVILYLAWVVDRPSDAHALKWLRAVAAVSGTLFLLTMTNDLHNLVFRFDLNNPDWSGEYGYGFVFWLVQIACYLPLAATVVIMLIKSRHSPRKGGNVLMIAFYVMLALYGYGYITRVPIAWDSDITMVTGLFVLLFFESAMRTGRIPVNTKYAVFFTHSPLAMRITDRAGETVLSSASVINYDEGSLASALASYPLPVHSHENTLLYAKMIAGGRALWQEDITGLTELHAEVEASIGSLTAANALLAKEEKIKRAVAEETEKTRLMTEFEAEISAHTAGLLDMIEQIGGAAGKPEDAVVLSLQLCYVKRQSDLFFRERETGAIPFEELAAYLEELAEIASYADAAIIVTGETKMHISVRKARLFYHFFCDAVDWAVNARSSNMFAHVRAEGGNISMRLLPSADARTFTPDAELSSAIVSAGGAIALTDYDDAFGMSLSLPEGGEEHS